MIRLYTSFYRENDAKRQSEILDCLQRNLECRSIDQVCLFLEQIDRPRDHDKLVCRNMSHRPTYHDFFTWINETADAGDISIVSNSDIYFDENLVAVQSFDLSGRCLALSRWDVMENGKPRLFERGDSQDCWFFLGPVRDIESDFPIGVYDCDNKIAWELENAGYDVLNPALSLRSYHLHQTEARSYDPAAPADHGIRPPFKYVEPENFGGFFECLRIWKSARMTYFPYRITRRKLMRTPPGRLIQRVGSKVQRMLAE